jgi:hypothetical protein
MSRHRFIGHHRLTAVLMAGLVAVGLMWATTTISGRAASIEVPTVHLGVEIIDVTP